MGSNQGAIVPALGNKSPSRISRVSLSAAGQELVESTQARFRKPPYMTRKKKTRSLADKVTIRTGKRKDYRRWRHDNPDEVVSSRRFTAKKRQQRKLQAARKLARQQQAGKLDLHARDGDAPKGDT